MSMIAFEAHRILSWLDERISYHEFQRKHWQAEFEHENRRAGMPENVTNTKYGYYEHARMYEHIHALMELHDVRERVQREIEQAEVSAQFDAEGYRFGRTRGAMVFTGDLSGAAMHRIVQGIEDGDPEILDELPQPNLSGEWADEASWPNVWEEITQADPQDFPDDGAQELYEVYTGAFQRGVHDQVMEDARTYGVRS